ncbi:MAG: hypothetical protein ONB44_24815 [candidate division KSB1 bacterium]|nr:hypothetical protein [candidate division KSB1 bacterium]MDZ7305356.1 hypothetical protein [candidate division KSB1 bacterium]MDZ7314448.1 hypothetical protein [candidate division KSB1 bacterium]
MDFWKLIVIAIVAWLLFLGGRGFIPKDWQRETPSPQSDEAQASSTATAKPPTRASAAVPASHFAGQPDNVIPSVAYLKSKAKSSFELSKVHVTYYLIDKSERCQIDSLESCLRDRIRTAQINARDFQYTYFFDRALNSGTGILTWQGQQYMVRYDKLREYNWSSGERSQKNNYSCTNFSYRSKKAIEFITANLAKKDLFTPLQEVEYPNGLTVSGQPAVDWRTLSINPADFPMSVPNEKRRAVLTQRFTAKAYKAPAPRVFVVLEFANGNKYLTEAADGGSGVQKGWVDWRIGNTSTEIRFFHSLGNTAKATCFIFDDPTITLDKVLEQSRK